jgi:hypothetical protein
MNESQRHAGRYAQRRPAMVFDTVASRHRRPSRRMLPVLERFAQSPAATSLAALAEQGPGDGWGLRPGEPEVMRGIARGLTLYAAHHRVDEEAGVLAWANATATIAAAPALDPYVGSVPGVDAVLFADIRMRSGGDGIKPDLRTRAALRYLGFDVPAGEPALLALASAVAAELDQPLVVLDQLLWSVSDQSLSPIPQRQRPPQPEPEPEPEPVLDLRERSRGSAHRRLKAELAGQ